MNAQTRSAGSALISVVILSAIVYLAIVALLILAATETQIAYYEQRTMQAFYGAESALTLGIADLRGYNGEKVSVFNEAVIIGGEPATFSSHLEKPKKKETGVESLYHHSLVGTATRTGPNGATTRAVQQDIVIKPFALFASKSLQLRGGCAIAGHAHGNDSVSLDAGALIDGNLTSSAGAPAFSEQVTGKAQGEEEMRLPIIPLRAYYPKYIYKGEVFEAEPLALPETIPLIAKDDAQPPAAELRLYAQTPSVKNPAGVFYVSSEINSDASGALVALAIQGTLLLEHPVKLRGIVQISAVDNFPALVNFSENPLEITLMLIEKIAPFLDATGSGGRALPNESLIQGLIYSLGDVAITADDVGGTALKGSIFAKNITLTGNPTLKMEYNLRVLTNSPPGLQLVERSEWREYLTEDGK